MKRKEKLKNCKKAKLHFADAKRWHSSEWSDIEMSSHVRPLCRSHFRNTILLFLFQSYSSPFQSHYYQFDPTLRVSIPLFQVYIHIPLILILYIPLLFSWCIEVLNVQLSLFTYEKEMARNGQMAIIWALLVIMKCQENHKWISIQRHSVVTLGYQRIKNKKQNKATTRNILVPVVEPWQHVFEEFALRVADGRAPFLYRLCPPLTLQWTNHHSFILSLQDIYLKTHLFYD